MGLAVGTRVGPYEVVAPIGAGGMGEVYRARDTQLKRDVALKLLPADLALDPERLARFDREAQALAALNHPHIAQVYGVVHERDVRAIAMELVEGATLAERIARGPVPIDEALPLALQLADALEYAHERGIVHRDLKPANIKLSSDGEVKVLDFGLAKVLAGDGSAQGTDLLANSPTMTSPARLRQGYGEAGTQVGVILGTAAYMSPEQARGAAVDKRADIWGFGVVLFETLTGKPCFAGDTVTDVLAAVVKTEPDWRALPPSVQWRLRELLERCLAKDKRQRLHDIGDARLELQRATGAAGGQTPGEAAIATSRKGLSKRAIVGWVLFAAAMVGAAFLARTALHGDPSEAPPVVSYLVPPSGSVSCFRDGFAVSPDGRKIVFSSLSSNGERLLWVRDLGQADSVALAGTDGAIYPFWSPNGRDIGFSANGSLKRIAARGGPVQVLCPVSMWESPAAWTDADVIVFAHGNQGLLTVSANGGEPTPLVPVGDFPSSVNDGLFCFTKLRNSIDVAVLASLKRPQAQSVIEGMSNVVQLRPAGGDWFLYYRPTDRTLVAQRADMKTARAIAPPRVLAAQVPSPNGYPSFSVSPSLAAFVANPAEARNDYASRLTWVARGGTVLGSVGETKGYWNVRLSHDGRQIATTPDDDVWRVDAATGVGLRLTQEASVNRQASWPLWSPLDDRLLVHSGHALREYVVSDPSRSREILTPAEAGLVTDWSRDGRFLAVTRNVTSNPDLAYYDLREKRLEPFLATPACEAFGLFSPDGHWIAYVSNASGNFEVYVRAFPSGGQEKRASLAGGMHPRWRGDGRELFFLAPDGSVMAAPVEVGPSLEIGTPRPLFRMTMVDIIHGLVAPYDVAPDGSKFLVVTPVQSSPVPLTLIQNWKAFIER